MASAYAAAAASAASAKAAVRAFSLFALILLAWSSDMYSSAQTNCFRFRLISKRTLAVVDVTKPMTGPMVMRT